MKKRSFINIWTIACLSTVLADDNVPQSRFVDLEGVKVHYQELAKGTQALIFIHGWACNADLWQHNIRAFATRHVVAIDLPGHGQSDKPKTDYTMEYFARSIRVVMRDAGVKQTVLIGHSSVVIVDGTLRPLQSKEAMQQVVAAFRSDYRQEAARSIEGMLQPVRDEKFKEKIRTTMFATHGHVGMSAIEAVADDSIWKRDPITAPVLAILAASEWWAADTEAFYRSIAPDIDFQVWQGVSHFLMMEQPEDFNWAVKRFISSRDLLSTRP